MLFFGHIAASLLVADATGSDRAAAVAGNLLPDVLDKTGAWVLRLTPSARWLAHGLPCFAVVSLIAGLFLEPRRWRGFVLGYAGHLACDLWAGGRVPWLAPFRSLPRKRSRRSRRALALYLLPEAVGAPLSWWLLARREKAGSSEA
jgi:hypothetical protein